MASTRSSKLAGGRPPAAAVPGGHGGGLHGGQPAGQAGGRAGGGGEEGAPELSSLRFAAVARQLGDAARQRGMEVPAFRSPPRAPGVRRAIRRETDGSATVSVALRGRPALAVVADMIDGLMAASGVTGIEAGVARDELWSAALTVFSATELAAPAPAITARSAA